MRHLTLSRAVALAAAILLVPLPAAGPATAVTILPGTVDPTSIDFGIVEAGTASDPRGVVYQNVNDVPVTIAAVQVIPAATSLADWRVTAQTCGPGILPSGGTCSVYIVFEAPRRDGIFTAQLRILDGSAEGAAVALSAQSLPSPGNVDWLRAHAVRGSGTNLGGGLARTESASADYLHTAFTGDTVAGVPVREKGPYRLVAYTRSRTDGATWKAPIRLNPSRRHGTDPTSAAAGSTVYVAWLQLAHVGLDAAGPRVLYVRVNRSHGTGAWEAARRLTSLSGRIMGPRAAASRRFAYVAYTDAVSGQVRVARSRDRGRTWAVSRLGSTLRGADGRLDAGVSVAASGAAVVVSWISRAGVVKVRYSSDGGATWKPTVAVGSGADAGTATAVAALSTRLAVAWVDGAIVRYATGRTTRAGWPASIIGPGPGYVGITGIALAFTGRYADLGLLMATCLGPCDPRWAPNGAPLVIRESDSIYGFWHGPNVLVPTDAEHPGARRPSILYASPTDRFAMATVLSDTTWRSLLIVREGIGTP